MADATVVICLDGCGPEYLAATPMPHLNALGREGRNLISRAVMPTVTNVNNTSIVTGAFPNEHGITSNWYRDRCTGEGRYMESSDDLLSETVFHRLARQGKKGALLTAKDKLGALLAPGAHLSASAEKPPAWLVELAGPPPGLYTVDLNLWLLDAALAILARHTDLDFLYVTTTDYVTHTYTPEHEQAQRHFSEVDKRVGKLADQFPTAEIAVTADHGMHAKTAGLDLTRILRKAGIAATAIPIIKDRHVVHHQNLSGSVYVYLDDAAATSEAQQCLEEVEGVEQVLTREEAARDFHLHEDRIGDLMVLAGVETVFGDLPEARAEVRVRSHGSLHEQAVPIIIHGRGFRTSSLSYNKDILVAWRGIGAGLSTSCR